MEILHGLRPTMEAHHGVGISDEILVQAVKFSTRYVGDRQLLDKAIDLLDQACARTLLQNAPTDEVAEKPASEMPDDEAIEAAIRAGAYVRAKQLHAQKSAKNEVNPE